MKGLIFLMIMFSFFSNFTVDEFGWMVMYKMEFPNPTDFIKSNYYDFSFYIIWALLFVAHVATISLLFLTHKKYFSELLFCAPLLYIIFFVFFNLLAIPLLFPFILIWLTALLYPKRGKININIKIEILLLIMFLCFLFAAISIGASLSQFGKELLAAFSSVKYGNHRWHAVLWLLLLTSNIALISLIFFRKKRYFEQFLIWVPALFIALFIVYNYMAFFFLIPFVITWTVTLIKERQQKTAIQLTA